MFNDEIYKKYEKLLIMNNFSFSNSVFYPFGEIEKEIEIEICTLLENLKRGLKLKRRNCS